MVIDSHVIEYKGMPLFQKARFKAPFTAQGTIQDFACFFYMLEGNMASYDWRGRHLLQAREAVIKNCGNYVQQYLQSETSDECEAIAVYLYPDMLREIFKNEVPSFIQSQQSAQPQKYISNKLIEQYISNLFFFFEEPDTFDEELANLKLKELILILLKSEKHQSVRQLLSELFAPANLKFQDSIEKNLFNNLTIEQLAFIYNMSLSTFKREFKKAYADTPARYIKNRRLEHAAQLLLTTSKSVSDIAYESGFEDLTTFSSVFTVKYRCSPSKYRLNENGK